MRVNRFLFLALAVALTLAACSRPRPTSTPQPSPTPSGLDVDRAFVGRIVPQQQATIVLAQAELQNGSRSEVKVLAQSIVDERQNDVQSAQQISQREFGSTPIATVFPSLTSDMLLGVSVPASASPTRTNLGGATDPDRTFLEQSIPREATAIAIANAEVQQGSNPRLRAMAQNIVANEAREVGEMETMLANPPG